MTDGSVGKALPIHIHSAPGMVPGRPYGSISVPETPSQQLQELHQMAWKILYSLEDWFAGGGASDKWMSGKLIVQFMEQIQIQILRLKQLIEETEEMREALAFRGAMLDVLAEESPELRSRVMRRVRDLVRDRPEAMQRE